ncbi:hypothetical protein KR032_007735, partial [Drosophila birchii]
MTNKRVSFDLMNLGYPVHTDPFELNVMPSQDFSKDEYRFEDPLQNRLLKQKLIEEAKAMNSDFFVRDPSSSDESDDYAFPETLNEQVQRLSFAKRRRLHYTEFATVDLARRLVCEEFALESSSLKSEDSAFKSQRAEEECRPCYTRSDESFPFLQYERITATSHISEESAHKEDPEPGFDPSHPCYHKLVEQLMSPNKVGSLKQEQTPGPTEPPTAAASITTFHQPKSSTDVHKDMQESIERHTRVLDKGEKWDLQ